MLVEPGDRGWFTFTGPFTPEVPEEFSMRITGTLSVPESGAWTFGLVQIGVILADAGPIRARVQINQTAVTALDKLKFAGQIVDAVFDFEMRRGVNRAAQVTRNQFQAGIKGAVRDRYFGFYRCVPHPKPLPRKEGGA